MTEYFGGVGARSAGEAIMDQSKTYAIVHPMTKLKVVSKNNRTHVEDEAGNRLWGVKSIKWEVDERDQPICTIVMYGVIAELDVTPDIKASPVHQKRNVLLRGPLPIPRKVFGGKKRVVR